MSDEKKSHMFEGLDVRTAKPETSGPESRDIDLVQHTDETKNAADSGLKDAIANAAAAYKQSRQGIKSGATDFGSDDIQILSDVEKQKAEKAAANKKNEGPETITVGAGLTADKIAKLANSGEQKVSVGAVVSPVKGESVSKFKPTLEGFDASLAPAKPYTTEGVSPLETYATDAAEAIRQNDISRAKIAIAEERRRDKERSEDVLQQGEKHRSLIMTIVLTILSVLFVVGGLGVAGFFVYYELHKTSPVVSRSTLGIIPIDHTSVLDITGFSGTEIIHQATALRQNATSTLGDVTQISFVEKNNVGVSQPVPASTLLREVDPNVPATLIRSLGDYVFGWHELEGKESFLIIKTDYYENAYAGMLRWEATMGGALGVLMADLDSKPDTLDINRRLQSTNNVFVDTIFGNKDVRELRDADNHIILMYSFIDPQTLLISGNEFAFKEILGRYTTAQLSR